eukprot:CAMPEP_0181299728 /NCGR_PEP_ID=MMETSP1101-20121128/6504_1 /TAXON_ID=46948 /ORGANISM="Rhodomonas abbreviata, Strain Caron Lab Isolate" /LENGTH=628 /DNA_ID=CAMNT_0023404903 /DNA_START=24 /DNA_END=1910 /DNA_ORIENTATION=+
MSGIPSFGSGVRWVPTESLFLKQPNANGKRESIVLTIQKTAAQLPYHLLPPGLRQHQDKMLTCCSSDSMCRKERDVEPQGEFLSFLEVDDAGCCYCPYYEDFYIGGQCQKCFKVAFWCGKCQTEKPRHPKDFCDLMQHMLNHNLKLLAESKLQDFRKRLPPCCTAPLMVDRPLRQSPYRCGMNAGIDRPKMFGPFMPAQIVENILKHPFYSCHDDRTSNLVANMPPSLCDALITVMWQCILKGETSMEWKMHCPHDGPLFVEQLEYPGVPYKKVVFQKDGRGAVYYNKEYCRMLGKSPQLVEKLIQDKKLAPLVSDIEVLFWLLTCNFWVLSGGDKGTVTIDYAMQRDDDEVPILVRMTTKITYQNDPNDNPLFTEQFYEPIDPDTFDQKSNTEGCFSRPFSSYIGDNRGGAVLKQHYQAQKGWGNITKSQLKVLEEEIYRLIREWQTTRQEGHSLPFSYFMRPCGGKLDLVDGAKAIKSLESRHSAIQVATCGACTAEYWGCLGGCNRLLQMPNAPSHHNDEVLQNHSCLDIQPSAFEPSPVARSGGNVMLPSQPAECLSGTIAPETCKEGTTCPPGKDTASPSPCPDGSFFPAGSAPATCTTGSFCPPGSITEEPFSPSSYFVGSD